MGGRTPIEPRANAGRDAVRVFLLVGMREAADLLRTVKVAGDSGRVWGWFEARNTVCKTLKNLKSYARRQSDKYEKIRTLARV